MQNTRLFSGDNGDNDMTTLFNSVVITKTIVFTCFFRYGDNGDNTFHKIQKKIKK